MPRPSLQIAIDRSDGPFSCGTPIAGTVTVAAPDACPDGHLVVAVGYRATGRAPNQSINNWQHTETRELFAGGWQPGTCTYPFTVTAPDGRDYAGAIMTVAWYVRAEIRTRPTAPFDILADVERPLEFAPSAVTAADEERRRASECVRRHSTKAPGGCLPASVLLIALGSLAAWFGAEHDLALPAIVVLLVGLAGLGLVIRQTLVGRKIKATELRIGSTLAWPGATIPCTVTLEAAAPLEVSSAAVTLEGWEHVKQFTGLNRTTGPVNTRMIHTRELPLAPSSPSAPAGATVRLSADVAIPRDAACTFDLDREVKFRWRLVFSVKVAGSPEWFDAAELTVLPRVAGQP